MRGGVAGDKASLPNDKRGGVGKGEPNSLQRADEG